jgi:hypothetical protein
MVDHDQLGVAAPGLGIERRVTLLADDMADEMLSDHTAPPGKEGRLEVAATTLRTAARRSLFG